MEIGKQRSGLGRVIICMCSLERMFNTHCGLVGISFEANSKLTLQTSATYVE